MLDETWLRGCPPDDPSIESQNPQSLGTQTGGIGSSTSLCGDRVNYIFWRAERSRTRSQEFYNRPEHHLSSTYGPNPESAYVLSKIKLLKPLLTNTTGL